MIDSPVVGSKYFMIYLTEYFHQSIETLCLLYPITQINMLKVGEEREGNQVTDHQRNQLIGFFCIPFITPKYVTLFRRV